nr:hypothetical protein [Bartonella taylorii]
MINGAHKASNTTPNLGSNVRAKAMGEINMALRYTLPNSRGAFLFLLN